MRIIDLLGNDGGERYGPLLFSYLAEKETLLAIHGKRPFTFGIRVASRRGKS